MRFVRRWLLCLVVCSEVWGGRAFAAGALRGDDIGSYPLDAVERNVPLSQPLPCRDFELTVYRGETLRYARPLRVHPAFARRLRAFEILVAETAVEHYGRAPQRVLHLGTHNCRRIRLYPEWLSEHALGNAIDVAGFVFAQAPRSAQLPAGLPRALRGRFEVKVDPHWRATRGVGAVHSAFLRELARRLIARTDIFRVVLGPAWPGHRNHFHLDCAPYRVTEVF